MEKIDINFNPSILHLCLLAVLITLLFLPFRTFLSATRYYFLEACGKIALAPVFNVRFEHFFFGDQFTSLKWVFSDLVYAIFYFSNGWSNLIPIFASLTVLVPTRFVESWSFRILSIIVVALPLWWRFLQCCRRFVVLKHPIHFYNAIKYSIGLISSILASVHKLIPGPGSQLGRFVLLFNVLSSTYSLYWDIINDWSLIQPSSEKWNGRLAEVVKLYRISERVTAVSCCLILCLLLDSATCDYMLVELCSAIRLGAWVDTSQSPFFSWS